jgi:hypothetical protein
MSRAGFRQGREANQSVRLHANTKDKIVKTFAFISGLTFFGCIAVLVLLLIEGSKNGTH